MLGTDIAIDLGTSSVKIYLTGKGIVLNEPSVVAYDTQTDEVVAIGREAYEMTGRTSKKIAVVRPLNNGVISDFSKLCDARLFCRLWLFRRRFFFRTGLRLRFQCFRASLFSRPGRFLGRLGSVCFLLRPGLWLRFLRPVFFRRFF